MFQEWRQHYAEEGMCKNRGVGLNAGGKECVKIDIYIYIYIYI